MVRAHVAEPLTYYAMFNPHPDAHLMLKGMSYSEARRFLVKKLKLTKSEQTHLIRQARKILRHVAKGELAHPSSSNLENLAGANPVVPTLH